MIFRLVRVILKNIMLKTMRKQQGNKEKKERT